MEDRLDLIVAQNWALIGLLLTVVAMSIFCGVLNLRNMQANRRRNDDENKPEELWDKDDLSTLLALTEETLEKHPNRWNDLHYRALALRKLGRNSEARQLFEHVANVEPMLAEAAKTYITAIDDESSAKPAPTSGRSPP